MKANDIFLKTIYNRYLMPTILSVLGGTVNVFIDGILVGRSLGENGLAAINLCMPVYLVFCTIGALIAAGASIVSSREIGRHNIEKSYGVFKSAILISAVCAIGISAVGSVFVGPLAVSLSGTSGLLPMVKTYLEIIFIVCLPKFLLYIPYYYLSLDGKNKKVSFIMLTLAALNVLFDALFLFALRMGIAGAAYANILATTFACVMGFLYLQKKDSNFRIRRQKASLHEAGAIIKNGSPVALDNLFTALRVITLNSILLAAGGSAYVSVFAVATCIGEFMLCILYGIPQTASSIIGIYCGEQDNGGIRILVRRQFRSGLIIMAAASALIILFSNNIGSLFGVAGNAAPALICLASSLVFAQINSNMTFYYNSVGRIAIANTITIARVFVFAVAAALCLSPFGGAVWLFYPLAEAATLLMWLIVVKVISQRNKRLSPILLLDDSLEKKGSTLNFSVKTEAGAICEASSKITGFCEANGLSPNQTMTISLAIEEMLVINTNKCFGNRPGGSIDVRVFHLEDLTGIRFRYGGALFNPVEYAQSDDDIMGDTMGIKMIVSMAKVVRYQSTFGVNSLIILI